MALIITFEGSDAAIESAIETYAKANGYGATFRLAEQEEMTALEFATKVFSNHFRSTVTTQLVSEATEVARNTTIGDVIQALDSITIGGRVGDK